SVCTACAMTSLLVATTRARVSPHFSKPPHLTQQPCSPARLVRVGCPATLLADPRMALPALGRKARLRTRVAWGLRTGATRTPAAAGQSVPTPTQVVAAHRSVARRSSAVDPLAGRQRDRGRKASKRGTAGD